MNNEFFDLCKVSLKCIYTFSQYYDLILAQTGNWPGFPRTKLIGFQGVGAPWGAKEPLLHQIFEIKPVRTFKLEKNLRKINKNLNFQL